MLRENFASRAGFLLTAAGCAIGLGNIWRFPYIVGQYGGAYFLLLYLFFLVLLGVPLMIAELAIGRGSRLNLVGAVKKLKREPGGFRWDIPAGIVFSGNLVLLMFYSVVTGWLFAYLWALVCGERFVSGAQAEIFFSSFLASPSRQILFMAVSVVLTVFCCIRGLRSGVENSIKYMMGALFLLLIVLMFKSVSMPGAQSGLKFFLMPDSGHFSKGILETVNAAMTQAFFTLSIGVGSIAICGSYMSSEKSVPGEALWIIVLDTAVALMAGIIIFPATFSFGVSPDAGPKLIFITLPVVFEHMQGGRFWGILFFLLLVVAALSTLVAVSENIIAFCMDQWKWGRKKSALLFGLVLFILSMPCILGFNVWSAFQPLGKGSSILDLEDFIFSYNQLPLGALLISLFCMNYFGWGKDSFFREANTGTGLKIPRGMLSYMRWGLPALILFLWILGLAKLFY